jgi:hypothetical protein
MDVSLDVTGPERPDPRTLLHAPGRFNRRGREPNRTAEADAMAFFFAPPALRDVRPGR